MKANALKTTPATQFTKNKSGMAASVANRTPKTGAHKLNVDRIKIGVPRCSGNRFHKHPERSSNEYGFSHKESGSPDRGGRHTGAADEARSRSIRYDLHWYRGDNWNWNFCVGWNCGLRQTTGSVALENTDNEFHSLMGDRRTACVRPARRRSGGDAFVRGGRRCLRLRSPLLRRACLDDSGVRLRLYLFVRNTRRNHRLDHRLGP